MILLKTHDQMELFLELCHSSPGRGCILNSRERRIARGLMMRGLVDYILNGSKERIYRATNYGRGLFNEGKLQVRK